MKHGTIYIYIYIYITISPNYVPV